MFGVVYLSATEKKERSKLGADRIKIMSEDMGWERLSGPVAFKLRSESWKRNQPW